MPDIHSAARDGFGTTSEAYARGRPDYPEALGAWLADEIGVRPGSTVVDLGAGTGKFTPLLLRNGAAVIAVEPIDAMRARLRETLPAVRAVDGRAEAMPLDSGSVDAVVCAQSFHWFANEAALAEIHRILRPGGRLGLVWNVRDASVDWVAAITRIIEPYEGDAPRFHKGTWREPFRAASDTAGMRDPSGMGAPSGMRFTAPVATVFPYVHEGPVGTVILDRFLSVSFIAALPSERRDAVADALRELAATHPALRGRARIAFPYRTEAYRCDRL